MAAWLRSGGHWPALTAFPATRAPRQASAPTAPVQWAEPDIAHGRNRPSSHLAVMAGTRSGQLAAAKLYPSYDIPEAVAAADLNGDRRNDVVVLHGGWRKLGIYYQQEGGILGPEQLLDLPYSSHYNLDAVTVGRIDSGPRPDIAIADNGYTKGLTVVRQR